MTEHVYGSSTVVFLLVVSYLVGSIPFGLIITRFLGLGDIRKSGSGNIGATNVVRKAGKFWGLITLICDGGKAALVMYLTNRICPDYALEIFVGMVAIFGHIFSIWLWFKGGKGVATALTVFLMLDFKFGCFVCMIWLVVFFITRISSLAAIIAFVLAPMMAYFVGLNPLMGLCISLTSLLVIAQHKENIKKLISGTEVYFK